VAATTAVGTGPTTVAPRVAATTAAPVAVTTVAATGPKTGAPAAGTGLTTVDLDASTTVSVGAPGDRRTRTDEVGPD
jgi:hypothetical protein